MIRLFTPILGNWVKPRNYLSAYLFIKTRFFLGGGHLYMYVHKLLKSFRPIASKPPTPNIYTKKKKILGFCQWSKDFNFFLMHRSNVSISIDLPSTDQRNVYTIVVRLFLLFSFRFCLFRSLPSLSFHLSFSFSLLPFLSLSLIHTHTKIIKIYHTEISPIKD